MEIILIIVLIILTVFAFSNLNNVKKELAQKEVQISNLTVKIVEMSNEISTHQINYKALFEKLQRARRHNEELSKYQDIINVKVECEYLLKKAQKDSHKLREEAGLELINSQMQSKEARRSLKELTDRKTHEIQLLYENAVRETERIILNAESKAESIGGDAYRSLREADQIAQTIKAMKNVIEGYGNEYIIPGYTLLDELADDYSHKEAGEQLKKLRQNNRSMIINRQAGLCDYVDEYRRTIAVDFVIDAYNGKVESILSLVKKDNYGILKQKIDDAFQLVNFNGRAFRNARISDIYHQSRIEELKWGCAAQELRMQELEEQRQIREQIREEEKACREFEKAIRDAEKEEQTLKRLIEKAQLQVAKANEEQKLQFQVQLEELQSKLQVAEEKNQRAISMAQQTRTGNVYIISNIGSFGENVYKIGMTRRLEPLDRVRELGDASVPFEFDVHAMIFSDDAPALERQLHKKFLKSQVNKINPRKEFFRLGISELKTYVDQMGINCKWTMAAEARQYRETLRLEQEMKVDKYVEAEWEEYQKEADPVTYEEVLESN